MVLGYQLFPRELWILLHAISRQSGKKERCMWVWSPLISGIVLLKYQVSTTELMSRRNRTLYLLLIIGFLLAYIGILYSKVYEEYFTLANKTCNLVQWMQLNCLEPASNSLSSRAKAHFSSRKEQSIRTLENHGFSGIIPVDQCPGLPQKLWGHKLYALTC